MRKLARAIVRIGALHAHPGAGRLFARDRRRGGNRKIDGRRVGPWKRLRSQAGEQGRRCGTVHRTDQERGTGPGRCPVVRLHLGQRFDCDSLAAAGAGDETLKEILSGQTSQTATPLAGVGRKAEWNAVLKEVNATKDHLLGAICNMLFAAK